MLLQVGYHFRIAQIFLALLKAFLQVYDMAGMQPWQKGVVGKSEAKFCSRLANAILN